jgi:two-component system KDP operon response regulator KdpE
MVAEQVTTKLKLAQDSTYSLPAAPAQGQDGLFIVASDGLVSYCSKKLSDMLGTDAAQLVGQTYNKLFHKLAALGQNRSKVESDLHAALRDLSDPTSVRFTTQGALDNPVQIGFFPIFGADNELNGWGGIISEAAAAWDEMAQWTEQLSVMTRSLRSSVATLKGFVTMMLNGHRYWGENERQNFLENIDQNVDQLSRLLENSQEFFRLELDDVQLDRRSTELSPLIQRTLHGRAFHKSGHQFELTLPNDLLAAEIDSLRVEQILNNLFDYAAHITPRDRHIQVTAAVIEDAVQVNIVCQGVSGQVDQIFSGLTEGEPGLSAPDNGIGLYVARGLVLAHGGRIWAENEPDETAAIRFTLPLKASESTLSSRALADQTKQKMVQQQNQPAAGLEIRPNREIAKVLVVDDDPAMLRLMKIKLEAERFDVVSAPRGSIAMDLAVTEQPDVILLDLGLPDSSGFDICARLREFTTTPIIIITGNSKEDDMVRGLELGADDYLVKPVRSKELLARVRANLRRVRVPDQAPNKAIFRTSELTIDFAQRQVAVRNQPVRLTPTEYKLLYHLAANAGRILTHSQLLLKVWGPGYEEDTQYLWVNISRLRGKIESDPSEPEYILTEPGVGYYIPAP